MIYQNTHTPVSYHYCYYYSRYIIIICIIRCTIMTRYLHANLSAMYFKRRCAMHKRIIMYLYTYYTAAHNMYNIMYINIASHNGWLHFEFFILFFSYYFDTVHRSRRLVCIIFTSSAKSFSAALVRYYFRTYIIVVTGRWRALTCSKVKFELQS